MIARPGWKFYSLDPSPPPVAMRQLSWRPLSPMAATPPSMWSSPHVGPVFFSTCGSSWARCAAAAPIPNSHNAHESKDAWLPSATWASACDLFLNSPGVTGCRWERAFILSRNRRVQDPQHRGNVYCASILTLHEYSGTPRSIKLRPGQSICLRLRRPGSRRCCQKGSQRWTRYLSCFQIGIRSSFTHLL